MDAGRREVRRRRRGRLPVEPVRPAGTRYWQRNHQLQHRYTKRQPGHQHRINSAGIPGFLQTHQIEFRLRILQERTKLVCHGMKLPLKT